MCVCVCVCVCHNAVLLPPACAAAHGAYLIRQLQVTAEVLSVKLEGTPLAAVAKECSRAALLTSAAQVSGLQCV